MRFAKKYKIVLFATAAAILLAAVGYGMMGVDPYGLITRQIVNSRKHGRRLSKIGQRAAAIDGSEELDPELDGSFLITRDPRTIVNNRVGAKRFRAAKTGAAVGAKLGFDSERRNPPNVRELLTNESRKMNPLVISNAGHVDLLRPQVNAPPNFWTTVEPPTVSQGGEVFKPSLSNKFTTSPI